MISPHTIGPRSTLAVGAELGAGVGAYVSPTSVGASVTILDCKKMFGSASVMAPRTADLRSAAAASVGVTRGVLAWISAKTPETCGQAIEVPDMLAVDVSEL